MDVSKAFRKQRENGGKYGFAPAWTKSGKLSIDGSTIARYDRAILEGVAHSRRIVKGLDCPLTVLLFVVAGGSLLAVAHNAHGDEQERDDDGHDNDGSAAAAVVGLRCAGLRRALRDLRRTKGCA